MRVLDLYRITDQSVAYPCHSLSSADKQISGVSISFSWAFSGKKHCNPEIRDAVISVGSSNYEFNKVFSAALRIAKAPSLVADSA